MGAVRSSSSKAASKGNTVIVASSNKVLGMHSQRLCWSTPGKALPQCRGPDVISVSSTTFRLTVAILRKLCAQHGVPETIFSDNGTQYTSHEFRKFCKANAISHILSTPYHHPSNGRAERFVDTFNRGLLKLRGEGDVDKIVDTFLLTYRTTPSSTLPQQLYPAKLFFGRKPRKTLDILLPTKQLTGRDIKMERQFNGRQGAVACNFDGGDPVYVQHRQSHDWKAGSVAKRIGGRLYDVTLADGSTRMVHIKQMRLRSTQLTDDDFTVCADAYNLPVRPQQDTNGENGHLGEHAVDHNQQTRNQGTPALDDIKSEQSKQRIVGTPPF